MVESVYIYVSCRSHHGDILVWGAGTGRGTGTVWGKVFAYVCLAVIMLLLNERWVSGHGGETLMGKKTMSVANLNLSLLLTSVGEKVLRTGLWRLTCFTSEALVSLKNGEGEIQGLPAANLELRQGRSSARMPAKIRSIPS